jgi:hypothetical protein
MRHMRHDRTERVADGVPEPAVGLKTLGSADLSGLPATLRTVAHVISLDAAQ